MVNYKSTKNSTNDPTKLEIHSILSPEVEATTKCHDIIKKTVYFW